MAIINYNATRAVFAQHHHFSARHARSFSTHTHPTPPQCASNISGSKIELRSTVIEGTQRPLYSPFPRAYTSAITHCTATLASAALNKDFAHTAQRYTRVAIGRSKDLKHSNVRNGLNSAPNANQLKLYRQL